MKYAPVLALLIFFSTVLEASYARSIRVGSFLKEKQAEKELVKLEEFVQSDRRLTQLRDKYHFEVKLIIRGKYYLNVIEPLMKKDVVQEILDILRTEYSYVYPKKIRFLPEYENYGEKKNMVQIKQDDMIDDSALLEKVDQILEDGKIEEDDSNDKETFVNRTKHLQKMEAVEDDSSIFDIFSSFNISEFFSDEEVEKKESVNILKPIKEEKVEEGFIGNTLDILMNYILEIMLGMASIVLLILLKFYVAYKKESKNKISMQDIYS